MKRRPEQHSMLGLMGAAHLETKPPFAGTKILPGSMKLDTEGNVLEVSTVGPDCPAYPESEDSDPWWDQPAQECNDDEKPEDSVPAKASPEATKQ